jgi:regulation of enolase protein 1 (concanavalin A-like superfamily)
MKNNLFFAEARGQMRWINPPENSMYTEEGGLMIEAPPGADFFQDPAGNHIVSSAPFLHLPVDSSFELTTRLRAEMRHIYDSGCLMLMSDDKNWAKLCFEFNGQYPTIVSVVTRDGSSDDCNSERVTVEKPYLRITKSQDTVSFLYSTDGEDWKLIRYFGMKWPSGIVAGVVAQSPKGDGCRVHFDYLQLKQSEADSRF